MFDIWYLIGMIYVCGWSLVGWLIEFVQVELMVVFGVLAIQYMLLQLLEVLAGLLVLAHHPHRVHNQALISDPYQTADSANSWHQLFEII